MTNTRSDLIIVCIRCAIVITVAVLNVSYRRWDIFCSVTMSMLAVASSKIIILFLLRIALTMHINCFSPVLRVSLLISSFRWSRPAFLRRLVMTEVLWMEVGSILNCKLPLKMTGSYGITVIFSLNTFNSTFEISTWSIEIDPYETSSILVRASARVDFPDPVLPTTPIFSPPATLKLIPFKTRSRLGRYFTSTVLNMIVPSLGQSLYNYKWPDFS